MHSHETSEQLGGTLGKKTWPIWPDGTDGLKVEIVTIEVLCFEGVTHSCTNITPLLFFHGQKENPYHPCMVNI